MKEKASPRSIQVLPGPNEPVAPVASSWPAAQRGSLGHWYKNQFLAKILIASFLEVRGKTSEKFTSTSP